jgi:hypothetical protein
VPRDGVARAASWISAMSGGAWVVVVVDEVDVEVDVDVEVEVDEASSVKRAVAGAAVVVGPLVVLGSLVVVEHGSVVVVVDSSVVVDPASVVVADSVPVGAQLVSTASDVVPVVVSASAWAAVTPTKSVKPATVIVAVLPNNDRIDRPA